MPEHTGPPALTSARLMLRSYAETDAADIVRLCGDARIADTTLRIPHPYAMTHAHAFLAANREAWQQGTGATWAVCTPAGALTGGVGLTITRPDRRAELGYWIAVDAWGNGLATEAARSVLDWAFDTAGLQRVVARHLSRNPASGRVLQKLGMTHEGRERAHVLKNGVFEDLECYGILAAEWPARRDAPAP